MNISEIPRKLQHLVGFYAGILAIMAGIGNVSLTKESGYFVGDKLVLDGLPT